jgi:ABC-type lipopolysaccharide export system ATPase subunit
MTHHAPMDYRESLEALAVVPLSAEERRRREIMLARVMLLAIDIVVLDEPLGLEAARDLIREIKHTYFC